MGFGIRHGAIAMAAALLVTTQAVAAGDPAQVCQAKENKEAGKYAFCRQKAYAKYLLDPVGLAAALDVCDGKFQGKWASVRLKAGGACPSPLDAPSVGAVIAVNTDDVAAALAGGPLPDCPGELSTCTTDLATCNGTVASCQGDLSTCNTDLAICQATPTGQLLKTGETTCSDATGASIPCAGTGQDGELQRGLSPSYVDNGDGTISDLRTGLMWEKLVDDGSIHDKDDTYTWCGASCFTTNIMDGTITTMFLAALNGGSGFAGHTDWRIPNANELESIRNLENANPATYSAFNAGCAANCTVTMCSCTQPDFYWSSTTYPSNRDDAWFVQYLVGILSAEPKNNGHYVRAVRAGS